MRRIAVFGCGGSGKTTLANEIGRRLDLPVLHIDGFYWRDAPGRGNVESSPAEWARTHRALVARDCWVIEGMKLGVLPERLAVADTAVFLDVSTLTCLWGVARRRIRFRGRFSAEMGVYDRITWEFLRWVWSFRRVQRPRITELLADCPCEVVQLRNWREARRYAARLVPPPPLDAV